MNACDKKYINLTIDLALKAEGSTSPNPIVGAVLVKSNRIIAKGFHRQCGQAHAEIEAINKAGKKAKGADLYVNLEPCSHFGRTGPCTDAIINAGIKRVIIGMKDPNPLTCGKGISILKKNGIKVELCRDSQPFQQLNEIFNKYITKKIPFIAVKAAQSIDGKIATKTYQSKWITGKHSRDYSQCLRKKYDAIMVGVNTILKDNPYLSCRFGDELLLDSPVKIIVDATLKTPANSNIFSGLSPAPVIMATTTRASKKKIQQFNNLDADVIVCPVDKNNAVDLKYLINELAKNEITSILVEGGGKLNGSFFDAKLVDKAYFFIAPKIIGGEHAVLSVAGTGCSKLAKAITLENVKYMRFGEDFLIEGNVKYS
ncbi:MAG: bifunctional diaminohydroxyphosphoribosylaminopyrimidine deaminase/5-amino-6-(5-phosphoribosylamino)uracil reductase RibD [Candidatus Omnitrophica bacterium]|nr:bifunctional diaminohydroxyphosphoribosylaminopyrimidine deaminase/5-amino-6-(5-phosphoribosylamino)uracil reductase RibD [Candidatus Omnitrophota bacterium]